MVEGLVDGIRADLSRRIGAIEWRGGPGRIAGEVDAVRRIAHLNGLRAAETVAHERIDDRLQPLNLCVSFALGNRHVSKLAGLLERQRT